MEVMKELIAISLVWRAVCIVSILIDAYKDVYRLVVEDRDALNKHIDCKMKHSGREKEYVTLVIVATPSKRWRLLKDLLVFVNTIPTSTSNTPLTYSIRLKNKCFNSLCTM